MRGLGARRHRPLVARPGAGGAVAEREDVLVAAGLERLVDHQLVAAVDLEAVERGEPGRALDARGPDDQVGRDQLARPGEHALGGDFGDLLGGADLDRRAPAAARSVASCRRSGSAGSTLGAASIRRISTSRSGSMPRRP